MFWPQSSRVPSLGAHAAKQLAKRAQGTKQVHADGRFAEPGHGADLPSTVALDLGQQHDRSLPFWQSVDGRQDLRLAFAL